MHLVRGLPGVARRRPGRRHWRQGGAARPQIRDETGYRVLGSAGEEIADLAKHLA
ncbi:MAG TPA: hypothetical protein VG276_12265 [Actinomycetes bacterium]|nr:hypothetical protein [Actinomycetes bacterium]